MPVLEKAGSYEVQNNIKDNMQHTKPYNYNKIIINVIMFLFDQTKAVIMITFWAKGDLLRSLFLYCTKYNIGGTLKYGLQQIKNRSFIPTKWIYLSFLDLKSPILQLKRGKSRVNTAVFLDPRSDHYIFIINLKIADTCILWLLESCIK